MADRQPLLYLVTSASCPNGESGTPLLIQDLQRHGIHVELVVWNDPTVDWSAASLVAVRSTWDYQDHLSEFLTWAKARVADTHLLHGEKVFAWNTNKKYLHDLQANGVPIVPTVYAPSIDSLKQAILKLNGKVVVKPAIGASGEGVQLVGPEALAASSWLPAFEQGPWVIQPFLESVRTEGETTVFIIDGKVISQLRKLPGAEDFRIHGSYGGHATVVPVTEEAAEMGMRAYRVTEQLMGVGLGYARMDMLTWEGRLVISEVEVTEPSLSFARLPENRHAFVGMIRRMIVERS